MSTKAPPITFGNVPKAETVRNSVMRAFVQRACESYTARVQKEAPNSNLNLKNGAHASEPAKKLSRDR
jgi:hypothetical protein